MDTNGCPRSAASALSQGSSETSGCEHVNSFKRDEFTVPMPALKQGAGRRNLCSE